MNENYVYNMNLKGITNLFQQREAKMKDLIGNLNLIDIETDDAFEKTLNSIKKSIKLEPVVFDTPQIKGHYQTEKIVQANYQNLFGGTKRVNEITIATPFTGSNELFEVMPINVQYSSGRIYQPVGKTVTVMVELDELDKTKALAEANSIMSVTKSMLNENNKQAQEWNTRIELQISHLLELKRKELIEFYT